ncbi:hypothetical protein ACFLZP_00265 [Patescibacteria group bacterium]
MSDYITKTKREVKFFSKLLLLLGFRQSYHFSKNLLGMVVHPQLTTSKILAKKDFSQALLIFGLPFYLWFLWQGLALVVWFWFRPRGIWFRIGMGVSGIVSIFLLLVALYDLYWVGKYFQGKEGKKEGV